MLDILLEHFQDRFVDPRDMALVEGFLQEEAGRLVSLEHLVNHVVGQPLFQWDDRALDEGFIGLVRPYMGTRPSTSMLFLSALDDFKAERSRFLPAALFLEYPHVLSLINDTFNFHEAFLPAEPDPRRAAALTQIKYAGQYLSMYPRYLLIENRFGLDPPARFQVYKLLAGAYVTAGISRGVFVQWSHGLFGDVTIEPYLQNAIDSLCNYVQLPVLLAATLAGVPEEACAGLRRALGYLSLCIKIRFEKRVYLRAWESPPDPALAGSLLLFAFQGFAFLQRRLRLDPAHFAATRFPDMRAINHDIARLLDGPPDPVLLAEMDRRAQEYFRSFCSELDRLGLLGATRARLARCLESPEADHA